MKKLLFWSLMSGLVAAGAMGCVDDDDDSSSSREATPESVEQALGDSIDSAAEAMVEGLALMESSQMAEDFLYGEVCEVSGGGYYDEDLGEWVEEEVVEDCTTTGPSSDDIESGKQELMEILETRIFAQENVEDTAGGVVTYRLHGDVVCVAEDFEFEEDQQACADDIDTLEMRLQAEFSGSVLALDMMVGPDRLPLGTLRFADDELSAQADLEQLVDGLSFVAETMGEEAPDVPEQFAGEVKVGFYVTGDRHEVAFDIIEDLHVGADDFEIQVEAVGRVAALMLDSGDGLLGGEVDLGSVYVRGPIDPSGGDEIQPVEPVEPGEEPVEPVEPVEPDEPEEMVEMIIDSAGATAAVSFDPALDTLDISGVSLGGGPTTVAIEGEEVVRIDLSSAAGQAFDALLQMDDEGLEAAFTPGFEVAVQTQFHRVSDIFENYEEWMLDEVLSVALGGASSPSIRAGEFGLEVLAGELSLSSQATEHGAVVEAGMCLLEEEPFDDASGPAHPFQGIEAGQCQE